MLTWAKQRGQEEVVAIGAPSSPALTNCMMYKFDQCLNSWCTKNDISYTRYADDISFSGNDKHLVLRAKEEVLCILHNMNSPRLILNDDKTVFAVRPFRRFVTGLYLSNDGNVSLGRERKRKIRSQVNHYKNGDLDAAEIKSLRGMISFSKSVEPDFVARLEAKYRLACPELFGSAES